MANNNRNSTANKVEVLVMYKDCMHNHAAKTMGFVLDGCGMFEPSGPIGTPEARLCAACHCHRNFHRRVEVELPQSHMPSQHGTMVARTPLPRVHQQNTTSLETHSDNETVPDLVPQPHVLEQRSTQNGAAIEASPARGGQETGRAEEVPAQRGRSIAGEAREGVPAIRRMTREQSERVRALCERNGWQMFRDYTAEEVSTICSDIGITRIALKSSIYQHRRRKAALQAAETD